MSEIHAASFPENRDIALSIWNMYTLVGIAWQTGWSTSLCVELKIYIQIGMLVFSIICYGKILYITNVIIDYVNNMDVHHMNNMNMDVHHAAGNLIIFY